MKHLLAFLLVGCGGPDFTAGQAPPVEQAAGSGGAPVVAKLAAAGGAVPVGAGGVPGTGGAIGTGGSVPADAGPCGECAPGWRCVENWPMRDMECAKPCLTWEDCPSAYCVTYLGVHEQSARTECVMGLPSFCAAGGDGKPCI